MTHNGEPEVVEVRRRVTVDCWVAGCGWSAVGWNYETLDQRWQVHAGKRHNEEED